MSRKGTVAAVDREQAVVAIAVEGNGYTVIELTSDWAIDVGDAISWENDDALGFEHYENISKSTHDDVFVQNHYIGEQELRLQFPH